MHASNKLTFPVFLPKFNNLSRPILLNILSKAFLSLHKLEKMTLSYKNIFCTSPLAAINSGLLYKFKTSPMVESNTGDSAIIGIALSLFEQACKTFLLLTSNPKFLLFTSGVPSSLNNL